MTPERTRGVVAASGLVVAATAAVGLWVFGGPAESRREERDAGRLGALQQIADALACHVRAEAAPPADLASVTPGCLSPSEAGRLVDPLGADPYAIEYPAPGLARVCAAFERSGDALPYAPPNFDRETGCLTLPLARR